MLEIYLIAVAIKSTILLAAGLLMVRCLRRQSAATRHLICLATLIGAAVVPMIARWSPQWSYPVTIPGELGTERPFADWSSLLAMMWAAGTLIFAVRAAGGWFLLRRARRSSVHFMRGEAAEVRIGNVSTPLTCGVVTPVIMLPERAREWDAPRLQAVLLHESAHVRRRDCLAKYVAQASRALLWWNPLAWAVMSRADEEQERACDEAVLSAGVAPEDYARALLDTARESSSPLLLGCAMTSSQELRARLEYLLAWRHEARPATHGIVIAIPLLLVLMTGVSCAGAKRMPATIAPGVNLVSVPNLRGAGPRVHK